MVSNTSKLVDCCLGLMHRETKHFNLILGGSGCFSTLKKLDCYREGNKNTFLSNSLRLQLEWNNIQIN